MKTMAQSSVVSSSSLGEIKMNETKILRPSFSLLSRLKLKVLFFCLGPLVPGKAILRREMAPEEWKT